MHKIFCFLFCKKKLKFSQFVTASHKKMSIELIFVVSFLINLINAEKWIKLPEIKPGHIREVPHDVPHVTFKLAPPPSILSSTVMNSVFSYGTTTETPLISTKRTFTRRYFQSTVTSKVITFPSNVSELIDSEEFLDSQNPVVHEKPIKIQRVKFFNQTTAMNVLPIIVQQSTEGSNKFIENGKIFLFFLISKILK